MSIAGGYSETHVMIQSVNSFTFSTLLALKGVSANPRQVNSGIRTWLALYLDALGAVYVVALPVGGEALRASRRSVFEVLSGIEQSEPFGLLTRLVAKLN